MLGLRIGRAIFQMEKNHNQLNRYYWKVQPKIAWTHQLFTPLADSRCLNASAPSLFSYALVLEVMKSNTEYFYSNAE